MISVAPFMIDGAYLIHHETHEDERGEFTEFFNKGDLNLRNLPFNIDQVNYVKTKKKDTFRGLHFQLPPFPQAKIIRCLKGEILDYFVDIRPNSPTFKMRGVYYLAEDINVSIYLGTGISHAYTSITDDCLVQYLVSGPRIPDLERIIRWDDPDLNLGIEPAIMSDRDKNGSFLKDLLHEL